MAFSLGQHLLLLLPIAIAVRALLVSWRRHRLVAPRVCVAGVGAGIGRGGKVAAVLEKSAVTCVVCSRGVRGFGCRASGVITIQFIYETIKKNK